MCRHFYSHSYCHCKAVQVATANKALKVLQSLKNCPGELNYNSIFLVRVCHPLIFQSSFRSYRVCHSQTCSVHGVQTSANKFHICIVLVAPVKWAIVKALIIHPSWISIIVYCHRCKMWDWGVRKGYGCGLLILFISLKVFTAVMGNPRRSAAWQQRAGVAVSSACQTIWHFLSSCSSHLDVSTQNSKIYWQAVMASPKKKICNFSALKKYPV